ncbi:MAG: C39 family peptidase [Roseburia sp.]|nr:C39 family peptidase [Roseburia sp.]
MRKKLDVIDVNERNTQGENEISLEEKRRRRQRRRVRQQVLKRRRRQQFFRMMTLGAISVAVLVVAAKMLFPKSEDRKTGGSIHSVDVSADSERKDKAWIEESLYEVNYEEFFEKNRPQQLSDAEVYERLKELAKEYPELEEIYEDCESYPVKLLASLVNNPEMHEYVKDYPAYVAGDTSVAGTPKLTEEEKDQKYPLFLQWDKRWGYEEYGDFNIALSGCGPTTLAMAAVALTDDHTVTPDKVAEYSMDNGFYVEGTGTAWSLMTDGCENFGIKAEEISLDEYVMKNQLDFGNVIICSMRPGDFTSVGHFIMIYDYDGKGFYVNDPNCIYRSSRQWSYEELKSQIRILWAYEKK